MGFCSTCLYSFDVSVLRTNRKFSTVPKLTNSIYLPVGKLTNHTVIKKDDKKDFTSTIAINTQGKKGVYIAFTGNGTCGGINKIRIWYIACPSAAGQLMNFPKRPAPSSIEAVVSIQGKCVENSVAVSHVKDNVMMCYANGTAKINGGCECQAGYYMATPHQCLGSLKHFLSLLAIILLVMHLSSAFPGWGTPGIPGGIAIFYIKATQFSEPSGMI